MTMRARGGFQGQVVRACAGVLAALTVVSVSGCGKGDSAEARHDPPAGPGAYVVLEVDASGAPKNWFLDLTQGKPEDRSVQKAIKVLQARAKAADVPAEVDRLGDTRVRVFVPGASDAAAVDRLVRRATLSVRKVDDGTSSAEMQAGIVHAGTEILPSDSPGEPRLAVWKRVIVTEEDLAAAKPGFSQDGAPIVNVRLNEAGTRRFAAATRTSIGQRLAVVLDGRVLTAPTVLSPIEEGQIQISGHFTAAEAQDLADMLAPSTTPKMDVIERGVVPGR